MRPIHRIGATTIAVLLTCGACAAGASAREPRLVISEAGTTAYAGEVGLTVRLGNDETAYSCVAETIGSLRNNAPTDVIKTTGSVTGTCHVEGSSAANYAITGSLRRMTLNWTGAVLISGSLKVSEEGPCIYTFSRLNATIFNLTTEIFPTTIFASGPAVSGFLTKGSSVACPSIKTLPVTARVKTETDGPLVGQAQI